MTNDEAYLLSLANALDGVRENISNVERAHRDEPRTWRSCRTFEGSLKNLEDICESILSDIEDEITALRRTKEGETS